MSERRIYPSPEDIAAGLSEGQRAALIEGRPDKTRGRNQVPLDKPIPGWRAALIILRGPRERPILTSAGLKVRDALVAQRDRNPKGKKPQALSRDPNELAKLITDLATGEKADPPLTEDGRDVAAVLLGRRGGLKGGRARAEKLSPEERRKIAQTAAKARWNVQRG